jgi:hypothetical protein
MIPTQWSIQMYEREWEQQDNTLTNWPMLRTCR